MTSPSFMNNKPWYFDDRSFWREWLSFSIDGVKQEADKIMQIRQNMTSNAYSNMLEASRGWIKEYFQTKKRIKKYKDEIIYVPVLEEIDTTTKDVWDRGVPMPFLEERIIEPQTNYKVRKLDDKTDRIIHVEKTIQVEIPPNPIQVDISIPSDLIHFFDHKDYHKNMKYIFEVMDILQEIVWEKIKFSVHIMRWKNYKVSDTENKIKSYGLSIDPEILTIDEWSYLHSRTITLGAKRSRDNKWVEVNTFSQLHLHYDFQIDLSWSIWDIYTKLISKLTDILDSYFEG